MHGNEDIAELTEGFSFADVQLWMQNMVVPQEQPETERQDQHDIKDIVRSSSRLSAERHLGIYRMSYIARLRECMRNQFSALTHALGKDLFDSFAEQYLDTYPSNSYTLNDLGKNFARFLSETRPDAHEDTKEIWPDFMIELAQFEYALSEIFDQHAQEEYTIATMETADELLRPIPVFHIFYYIFPVCNYYLAVNQKQEPELPLPGESFCAVTRHNYRLGLYTIKPAQYYFLQHFLANHSIPAAKKYLTDTFKFEEDKVEAVWQEWKRYFIDSGFFCTKL